MRLLIANSDPTMRDIYERFFSGEGYEVETVGDGVLVTSDYSEDEHAHELAPPVVGCLRKPFRLRELSDLIRSVTQPSRRQMAGGSLKELNVPSRRAAQH